MVCEWEPKKGPGTVYNFLPPSLGVLEAWHSVTGSLSQPAHSYCQFYSATRRNGRHIGSNPWIPKPLLLLLLSLRRYPRAGVRFRVSLKSET